MKNADKVAPVKPEQALDEEYEKLLRAKPGDPMPPPSSNVLRGAANGFRTRRQEIWDKMAQEIGQEKANGIRAMLRSESFPAATWQGLFNGTRNLAPLTGQSFRFQLDDKSRGKKTPKTDSDNPTSEPLILKRGDDTDAVRILRPRVAKPDTDEADKDDEVVSKKQAEKDDEAVSKKQAEKEARRSAARAQRADPAQPPTSVFVAPRVRNSVTVDGNGRVSRVYSFYGQVTLDELIDLFERKLAAMRH
jgi:hypothetical protein